MPQYFLLGFCTHKTEFSHLFVVPYFGFGEFSISTKNYIEREKEHAECDKGYAN